MQDQLNMMNFLTCQTVALESFQSSEEYLLNRFKKSIENQYLPQATNRKQKSKAEQLIKEEVKKFKKAYKIYVQANVRMISHFDDWSKEDVLNEKVDSMYAYLESKES